MRDRLHRLAEALAGVLPGRGGRKRPPGRRACPPGEPPFDFDVLAKDLAQGLSRREALRRLSLGLGTAALASLGLAAPALAACPRGTTLCGSNCANLSTDPNNCGRCGTVCPLAATCVKGTCVCPASAPHLCNGVCVDTQTDTSNCGKCGNKCPAGATCSSGKCVCPTGQRAVCNGACVNRQIDPNNCGVCGNVCPSRPNATKVCSAGQCSYVCASGFADCNASAADGCETNLTNDVGNCGACGNVCPTPANATAVCVARQCSFACEAGFGNCNGDPSDGCETDLATASNCGHCGHICAYGESCVNGSCTCGSHGDCPPGQTCCGGICKDLQGDVANCGACGYSCPVPANAVAVCGSGVCGYACLSPYGDCDNNPANGCETNTGNNVNNCGACGNVCAFPHGIGVCIGGTCELAGCLAGFGNCDGFEGNGCETPLNTTSNCGACGTRCASSEQCCNGTCISLTDIHNCGGCGLDCTRYGDVIIGCPADSSCPSGYVCDRGYPNESFCSNLYG